MPFDEAQLNGRIAGLIRHQTRDMGWEVREEVKGVLLDHKLGKPDIVIWRDDAPPVIVENEYSPGTTLERDCLSRLGRKLEYDVGGIGGVVSVVFALRSPRNLRESTDGEDAEAKLQYAGDLEFAVYRGTRADFTRFPKSGFLSGDVRDLVNFIKPATIPDDIVREAADTLTRGANDTAKILIRHSERLGFGTLLGEKLRQPWPALNSIPNSRDELKQKKADDEARFQTAKMCATMLINALAYQQNLSNHHPKIDDIDTVRERRRPKILDKSVLMAEWQKILKINYWPIFHIASELLIDLPEVAVSEMLPCLVGTAKGIQVAMRQNDVAGIVFQRLIADRKTLKTYYTRPESTVLVAHLGVHDDFDWSSPERVRNYRIADYACGTGGLLLAAYQRTRDLHRSHGGAPDELHSYMMEHSLTACDIMPAAVHLSSSLLSSVAPGEAYGGTRNILFGFGGVKLKDGSGEVIKDDDENPVLERDGRDRLVVSIGSLDLLDLKSTKRQVVLPINEQMSLGSRGERNPISVEISPMSQDLVIMNPPFTRPTNHAPFDSVDSKSHKNPAFAAFGTSDAEQSAMELREKTLGKNTISDGYAGLGSSFAAIAEIMVKSGGRIALILPVSSMLAGSYDGRQIRSWQKLRKMLADKYTDIIVVTIVQPKPIDASFSADTNLAECVIVARRLEESEQPGGDACFVNLTRRPGNALEAQEVARAIKRVKLTLNLDGEHRNIKIGDETVGTVSRESVAPLSVWATARVKDMSMMRRIRQLMRGTLHLPELAVRTEVPIVQLGRAGKVGPVHREINDAFRRQTGYGLGSEFPMLWRHDQRGKPKTQNRMLTPPDSSGSIKPGKDQKAAEIWEDSTHLHINLEFRFNANATAACYTERRAAGGSTWVTLRMDSVEQEKSMCVWMNGTLGMMLYWAASSRPYDGRGRTTVTSITNVATLDTRALPPPASPRRLGFSTTCKSRSCFQRTRPIVTQCVRSSTAAF